MSCLSIKLAGPAGFGIKSGGLLLSTYMQKLGLYFSDYSEYPSLVRGGHNTYQATYSPQPLFAVHYQVDLFFSLKSDHWQSHQKEFTANTLIFKNIPQSDHTNVFCLGIIVAILQTDINLAKTLIKQTYPQEALSNQKAFDQGYQYLLTNYPNYVGKFKLATHRPQLNNLSNLDGNQSFAYGFYRGGGKFYSAYPMTPATGALHELAKNAQKWGITVIHPEDEIAAASMAAGASFAGVPSAVGTSGGGFALMAETVSFCGVAEIGLVFYLVSRPGPATGLPTWTSQSDLLFSIFAGHGDFPKVVLAPTSQLDTFYLSQQAVKLASSLQTPVILLSDKLIAESNTSLPDLATLKLASFHEKLNLNPASNYHRYMSTPTGVSPRTIPGTNKGQFLANSYEHDSSGLSTENSLTVTKMVEKRAKKIKFALKLAPPPRLYSHQSDKLIISWGSPVGPILESFSQGLAGYDLLQLTTLWPLDPNIAKITAKYKQLICIENNQFGHLNFLLKTIGVNCHQFISKYDGRPFFPEDLVTSLKVEN